MFMAAKEQSTQKLCLRLPTCVPRDADHNLFIKYMMESASEVTCCNCL